MAGVLLYTAAPDSEGTLGGLVALGDPKSVGPSPGPGARGDAALRLATPVCRAPPDQGRADPARGGLPRLPVPARDLVRAGQQVPRPLGAGLHRRVGRAGVLRRLRRGRPRGDDHRPDRRVGHAAQAGRIGPQRDRRTGGPVRRAVSGVRAVVAGAGAAAARGRLRTPGRRGAGLCPRRTGVARGRSPPCCPRAATSGPRFESGAGRSSCAPT